MVRASKLFRVNFSINMTYTKYFFLNFLMRLTLSWQPQMQIHQLQGSTKKKVVQKSAFFFLPIRFHLTLIFKTATPKCMPHPSFISKLLHEYHLLFFNFRLDFVIGLKIKFDVCHRNVQNYLILPIKRLKSALYHFSTNISFD